MEDRLEISTPSSSSSKISTTADIPDIGDLRALLDKLISYLPPTLDVTKKGIACLGANVADHLSALRRFVTRHPYLSSSILVGVVLLFANGPFLLRLLLDILGFQPGGVARGTTGYAGDLAMTS